MRDYFGNAGKQYCLIMFEITGRDTMNNSIFPFLWMHGEDEETIRNYIAVIDRSNLKSFCVESRPHPDFCGSRWWNDMDIVIDEARKRDMQIWILDDSHFPTGYANGAVCEAPDELCRQSICCRAQDTEAGHIFHLDQAQIEHPEPFIKTKIEQFVLSDTERSFNDDRLFGLYAIRFNEMNQPVEVKNLRQYVSNRELNWMVPEGVWRVYCLHLSRNMGYHRNYINMMKKESCRLLIDAVYEPHYKHYAEFFGNTVAGFFSDEPELGNGHIYEHMTKVGEACDLPWSDELEKSLRESIGEDYILKLWMLWENCSDQKMTAEIRYRYMDAVTMLVRDDFSYQIGNWCRTHDVRYIGHLIEDNDQHSRTGSSLGHYFRGLEGQDMAGIDDIGGQVMPYQEDVDLYGDVFNYRIGEFYHYLLGKLASSAAAIEPMKNGDSMCEIFGAYGWKEGVRLEKFLLDFFLVRGVNHFVPHAFSPKEYPDPDCPPHFYARGNNPQYRHFGAIMKYGQRICSLISGGRHVAGAAVIYHGEAEWAGEYMSCSKPAHVLYDRQIDFDIIPQDVFRYKEKYRTEIREGCLKVNGQKYRAVIVPKAQFITDEFADAVSEMTAFGVCVLFIDEYPEIICSSETGKPNAGISSETPAKISKAILTTLDKLADNVERSINKDVKLIPADDRVRCYHYEHADGTGVILLFNEGRERYTGRIEIYRNEHNANPGTVEHAMTKEGVEDRKKYTIDAWNSKIYDAEEVPDVDLETMKGMVIVLIDKDKDVRSNQYTAVFDYCNNSWLGINTMNKAGSGEQPLYRRRILNADSLIANHARVITCENKWTRSICRSIFYPDFVEPEEIELPDNLASEKPEFSGFVRYDNFFVADTERYNRFFLEISDAYEGVEVFVNNKTLGIQVTPIFLFDMTDCVKNGNNFLRIEVATTLERENAVKPDSFGNMHKAESLSGITGTVKIYAGNE